MPSNKKIFDKLVSRVKIYLVIIAVLLTIICTSNINLVLPAILFYILVVGYAYWSSEKRKEELSEHIEHLTFSVDKAAKGTLINSPFPLIILETNGNTIWKNEKFSKEFINIDINNYLDSILKELKQSLENGEFVKNKNINQSIVIGSKTYKLLGEYIELRNKQSIFTLYFMDNTELIKTEEKYINSQNCIGIIMIDNYEELMQRVENEDRSTFIAQIEKNIYEWATHFEGLVIKSERDTFVLIFEQKYLSEIENKKFNILDEIKELEWTNKAQFTLSIAVSNEGSSNYEKYKSAQAGLDIVLGRGGDQAVVRENGKYVFFGGRAQEVEKRTKVKARTVAHALKELILEAENVMVMGHSNSDMDCIGSSMGIYRLARSLGKNAYIVNNSYGIGLENFMEKAKEDDEYKNVIINKSEALAKISPETLLIVVDTSKKNYVEIPELLEETEKIVVIDHHRRSTEYIEDATLMFHEVYASSAAELVTEILEYSQEKIELTELEAEALYAGIMMDTKNFTFKTGVRTFEAAAYLRKYGIDTIKVKKWFQSDLATYNKISKIVEKAEVLEHAIAISIYDEQDKDANIICAKAADELLTISNIVASFVIGMMGDRVCISGRSIGDINVQLILEKLGGGGHITLAGAQVDGMTTEEVKTELINRINEYFSEMSS